MKPISKINPRTLGDPTAFLSGDTKPPATEKRWLFGTIFGEAVGPSKRTSPDGETVQEGLQGTFEAASALKDGKVSQSSVLYLPGGGADRFLKIFRPAKDQPVPSAVYIGIDVYVIRADNADGYEWELVPILVEVEAAQPLEIVRKKIADLRTKETKVKK